MEWGFHSLHFPILFLHLLNTSICILPKLQLRHKKDNLKLKSFFIYIESLALQRVRESKQLTNMIPKNELLNLKFHNSFNALIFSKFTSDLISWLRYNICFCKAAGFASGNSCYQIIIFFFIL